MTVAMHGMKLPDLNNRWGFYKAELQTTVNVYTDAAVEDEASDRDVR
jgi:hypothetical protein